MAKKKRAENPIEALKEVIREIISKKGSVLQKYTEEDAQRDKEKIEKTIALSGEEGKIIAEHLFAGMYNFHRANFLSNKLTKGKGKGAEETNTQRTANAKARRELIKQYLEANPNPDTKGLSLEGHLIKILASIDSKWKGISERTIKDDLKKINLEKR